MKKSEIFIESEVENNGLKRRLALLLIQNNESLVILPKNRVNKNILEEFIKLLDIDESKYKIINEDEFLNNVQCKSKNIILYNFLHFSELNKAQCKEKMEDICDRGAIITSYFDKTDFSNDKVYCLRKVSNQSLISISISDNKLYEFCIKYGNKKRIKNNEIKETIIDLIRISERQLIIAFPWWNKEVFLIYQEHINEALKRGVEVYLCYGISGMDKKAKNTEEAICAIVNDLPPYNNLNVIRINDHTKQVISDDFWLMASKNATNIEDTPWSESASLQRIDFVVKNDILRDINKGIRYDNWNQ